VPLEAAGLFPVPFGAVDCEPGAVPLAGVWLPGADAEEVVCCVGEALLLELVVELVVPVVAVIVVLAADGAAPCAAGQPASGAGMMSRPS
jgi:hypothetical protein